MAAGQQHAAIGAHPGRTHHRFAGQQPQQDRTLSCAAHHRQIGLIHRQPQQPTGAAGHHQLFAVAAGHHPLQLHAFFEFEHGGGAAGKFLELLQRQALEAAIAAEQAEAGVAAVAGQGQHLDQAGLVEAFRQEFIQPALLLAGKFPAQQRHPAIGAEGQQARLGADRQDQLGRWRLLGQLGGFIQMEPAQHLRRDDLDGAIGQDQQATVGSQGLKGLLALQFGVGPDGRCPLGHQQVAAFHQAGAAWGVVALLQLPELGHQGVQQGGAIVQQMA